MNSVIRAFPGWTATPCASWTVRVLRQEIAAAAPKITDYLCDDCRAHFERVQEYLTALGVEFTIDPALVRGLDYYTRTVFEFPPKAWALRWAAAGVTTGWWRSWGFKPLTGLRPGPGPYHDGAGRPKCGIPPAGAV